MLTLSPQQRNFILRAVTAAGHRGATREELMDAFVKQFDGAFGEVSEENAARKGFGIARGIARAAKAVEQRVGSYVDRQVILEGKDGLFDARSLGCWLAVAEIADVPAVPAVPLCRLPEPLLELIADPEIVDRPATKPSAIFRLLDGLAGGALGRAFSRLDHLGPEEKQKLHGLALAILQDAGERIPAGHMVRHDHMGPGTLKAWAGIGWEPWSGDDGVRFRDGGHDVTLGPGWVSVGNHRYVDVTDSRTVQAVSQAMVDFHTFWARPWMPPARRFTGLDPHRPREWPEDQRRGSWPAEWRVFLRGGRAVGVASYYGWAEVAGDETDKVMADETLRLAQRMADAATEKGLIPDEPHLPALRYRSAEIREHLPEGTVNGALDFIETEDGLMFLEGAPPYAPCGYGAHPCAAAGQRWPEGCAWKVADGIDIGDSRTWGEEVLAPLDSKMACADRGRDGGRRRH